MQETHYCTGGEYLDHRILSSLQTNKRPLSLQNNQRIDLGQAYLLADNVSPVVVETPQQDKYSGSNNTAEFSFQYDL